MDRFCLFICLVCCIFETEKKSDSDVRTERNTWFCDNFLSEQAVCISVAKSVCRNQRLDTLYQCMSRYSGGWYAILPGAALIFR